MEATPFRSPKTPNETAIVLTMVVRQNKIKKMYPTFNAFKRFIGLILV